ncbi:hypothetical protein Q7P36_009078 [Cladosporium allicinum]
MGREQYLERLALGRSPFQPGPATNNQGNTEESQRPQSTETPNSSTQQYDTKGRPTNPATEAQNARLRHACNEVLALVGVVERKDSVDAQLQLNTTLRRTAREHLLILEDNRGNEWSAGLDVLSWFALWWPTALVRRIQVGIYSPDLSFTEILSLEAHTILGNGWRGLILGLLPGTGIAILHKILWQVSALIAEETIGYLQNLIVASTLRRRTAKRLIRSLTLLMDVLYMLLDILLLPLETYALARQISIAPPTTPWRPLLTTHLPSLFRSTFTAKTNPTSTRVSTTSLTSTLSHLTTSAAPHLLAYNLLTRDPSPSAPAFSDITSFRLPSVSEHDTTARSHWPNPPPSPYDPFAAILRHTRKIRQSFLRAVGWDVHEQQRPGATHGWETDAQVVVPGHAVDDDGDIRLVAHRSTSLARLPATWLGMRTDMFLLRLLMLPIESAAMRKVAGFYISSGMPLAKGVVGPTTGSNQIMSTTTMPGLWGFVTGKAGRESFGVVAGRLSQIGLGVALTLGVEVVLFGVVYGIARRDGVANYGWKRLGRDERKVLVEDEEEEDLVGQDEGRVAAIRN